MNSAEFSEPVVREKISYQCEVELLGLFAARCDVYASDPTITDGELRSIECRAVHYRCLQLEALREASCE